MRRSSCWLAVVACGRRGRVTAILGLGPDQIQVTTPPNAAGNVAVFVITADTEISVPGGFTYVDLADTGSSTTLVTLLAAILLVAGGLSVTLWVRGARD